MELQAEDPRDYLVEDDVVRWSGTEVEVLGARLRQDHPGDVELARATYELARDRIAHSWDVQDPRVTVTADEVLREGVGLCFAKSHLLAALLRSQGVPVGLCYQRLSDGDAHVLHGLVAVHLRGAWHRLDPRGNKPGVDAQFSLDEERLAWPVDPAHGERDYPQVLVHPDAGVVEALRAATDVLALCADGLPQALS